MDVDRVTVVEWLDTGWSRDVKYLRNLSSICQLLSNNCQILGIHVLVSCAALMICACINCYILFIHLLTLQKLFRCRYLWAVTFTGLCRSLYVEVAVSSDAVVLSTTVDATASSVSVALWYKHMYYKKTSQHQLKQKQWSLCHRSSAAK